MSYNENYTKKTEMDIKREGSTIYTNLRLLASNYFKEFKMQNVLIRHGYTKAQATSRCQNQKRDIKAYIIIFKYFSGIYSAGLIPTNKAITEVHKQAKIFINDYQ